MRLPLDISNNFVITFAKIAYQSGNISPTEAIVVTITLPYTMTTFKIAVSNCNSVAFTCATYNHPVLSEVQFAYSNKNKTDNGFFNYIQYVCIGY